MVICLPGCSASLSTVERAHRLGRNPVYQGFLRYNGRLYPARHDAIIDEDAWDHANRAIGMERTDGGSLRHKDDHVHLLKGIQKCGACGLAMTPYPSGKKTKDGTPYL